MTDSELYKDAIDDLIAENDRLRKQLAFHMKREKALARTLKKIRDSEKSEQKEEKAE